MQSPSATVSAKGHSASRERLIADVRLFGATYLAALVFSLLFIA